LEFRSYAVLLKRRVWLIFLSITLSTFFAFLASHLVTPVYRSSVKVLLNQSAFTQASVNYGLLLGSEGLVRTYSLLLQDPHVLNTVIANLNLPYSSTTLARNVSVTVLFSTQLLVLNVDDTDPQLAATIANELINVFIVQQHDLKASRYTALEQSLTQELAKLQNDINDTQNAIVASGSATTSAQQEQQNKLQIALNQYHDSYATLLDKYTTMHIAETQTTIDFTIIEPAKANPVPIRPDYSLNLVIGATLGFLIALFITTAVEYVDDSIKSSDQLEKILHVPTLSFIGNIKKSQLISDLAEPFGLSEAYRVLWANISFSEVDMPIRSLMFTSSQSNEGKSNTVANLAVAVAQAGKRVILVDANLRRPNLHNIFQRPNQVGLTTALLDPTSAVTDYMAVTSTENLLLLPSGPLPFNASELLGSNRMEKLLEDLKQYTDLVLLDTTALLGVSDAILLGRMCDASVLIVDASATQIRVLKKTKIQIAQAGIKLLGTVFNRVSITHGEYAFYTYNYSYSEKPKHKAKLRQPFWRRNLAKNPPKKTS
jgi:non-specific protein-tyrosine kinase